MENVSVPATTEKSELDFVKIPCTAVSETIIRPLSNEPAAVIRTASFQLEISNDISDTRGGVPCLKTQPGSVV